MTILFLIFTVICPLFFWVGADCRLAQQAFYQIFGTSLVLASLLFFDKEKVKKNRISLWFGIFAIYSCLLFILNGCRIGSSTMLNTFLACMLYFSALSIKKEDTNLFLKAIIWVCIVNFLYMALQQIGFDFIFNMHGANGSVLEIKGELIGFFGIKAHMGIFMALGLIAMLFINPWLSFIFIYPLYISKSSGAIAGGMAGTLFWFWWVKRKVFYILLPIFLIGGLTYLVKIDNPMGMMKTRPGVWKVALKDTIYGFNLHRDKLQSVFLRNPITGFGPESVLSGNLLYFSEALSSNVMRGAKLQDGTVIDMQGRNFKMTKFGEFLSPDEKPIDLWDNLHNGLIQLFFEYGFLGVIIVGFILFYLSKIFYNSVKSREFIALSSMIIVLLVSSSVQFPLYVARIGYIMPILLGLFIVNKEE